MRLLMAALSTLAVLAIVGGIGAYLLVQHYAQDLPDYKQLADYQPPVVSRIHAGDGRLLAELATEKRIFVPISAIPKRVRDAFISAEDKAFYEHHGVNPLAIARAVVTNIQNIKSDKHMIGASTITQQVAKNFLLTNERSFTRKIKEAILAYRMEDAFTKDHILELYLNEIFLGNRSYGVSAAALNYFNSSLDDLSIAQAAYLAALPKAPSNYSITNNHDVALERRNWVIGRMQEDGYITADEAKTAIAEPLVQVKRDNEDIVSADYFTEEVRQELIKRYGESALYEGGLSVRTTVNPRLQDIATRALRDGLMVYDRRHGWRGPVTHLKSFDGWPKPLANVAMPAGGEAWRLAAVIDLSDSAAGIAFADNARGHIPMAELHWARPTLDDQTTGAEPKRPADVLRVGDVVLVEALKPDDKDPKKNAGLFALRQIPNAQGGLTAVDPHTGRVLAMVGGFSRTMSVFNRATQAMRQPGSSFKPFIYLAALDNGFTPSSLILDAPIEVSQGPGLPMWRPNNYHEDYLGPTPLRVGIEKSRNTMTVRLAQSLGMPKVAEYAERFGVVDKLPLELSMALGAGETTTLRMTTAYAMLVNGGKRVVPTLIDRVQDRNGHTIYRHDDRPCPSCLGDWEHVGAEVPDVPDTREQIEDARSAFQMVSIMEGVVQRGTGRVIASLNRPLAGKTGTTNESFDTWFVGFSPDLAVGLYVGFDQPRTLGGRETGGSVSAPIFKQFMAEALADTPAIPFRVPPGIRLVRTNPATGQLAEPGERNAIWEAFKPGTEPGADQPVLEDSVQGVAAMPGEDGGPLSGSAAPAAAISGGPVGGYNGGAAPLPAGGLTSSPPRSGTTTTNTGTGGLY